jgi:hypothetical protein
MQEEDIMKKFGYIVAAIVTLGLTAPSIASAETVVVRGGDHHRHFHPHHDHVVIIKHRHHD